MASHCATSSSSFAFLGVPLPGGRRHQGSCCFVAGAKMVGSSAVAVAMIILALDTDTTMKPLKSRARRARKSSESDRSTALLDPESESVEAKDDNDGRALVALDDVIVNPVGLGHWSRQIFDEVCHKVSRLRQMSTAPAVEQE
ncbi:hypothetical protein GUJ93_ZPchr0013g37906 [Zizania palustris]|uniref:Uncharacterized protein n=1 Tax=Zizania palustris TaxID=103762 RepID=A0A8J5WQF9_ZIZPA|nr:hypothetical protein GUJ93_ZPchr0013g37906 [Zizania palustris]